MLSSPPADYDTWPEWSREKLDQNIPIDRKGTGTHWQLRSVVLHTFVFVFVFVCFGVGRKEDRMLRIDVQGRGG